ncbi:MAG: universal stress protein [Nitrososphaeraceae archaeon]
MTGFKILVPHDGSEESDKALFKCQQFAIALKAEVIVLYVIDHEFASSTILGFIDNKTSLEQAKKQLKGLLKKGMEVMLENRIKELKENKIIARFDVISGSPSSKIINYAKENKIDLIIMASKRLERFNKIYGIGSVARKVSEAAPCPVMIIH